MEAAIEKPSPEFREWIEKSCLGRDRTHETQSVAERTFAPPAAKPAEKRAEPKPLPQPKAKAAPEKAADEKPVEQDKPRPRPAPAPMKVRVKPRELRTTTKPRKRRRRPQPKPRVQAQSFEDLAALAKPADTAPRLSEPQSLTHYKLPVAPPPRKKSRNPLSQIARLLGAFR